MCGIYGIFDPGAPLGERKFTLARRAQSLLCHRGPGDHRRDQLFRWIALTRRRGKL